MDLLCWVAQSLEHRTLHQQPNNLNALPPTTRPTRIILYFYWKYKKRNRLIPIELNAMFLRFFVDVSPLQLVWMFIADALQFQKRKIHTEMAHKNHVCWRIFDACIIAVEVGFLFDQLDHRELAIGLKILLNRPKATKTTTTTKC